MEVFKIVGLGLSAAIISVFVKNWRAELSMQISLIAAVVIFFTVLPYMKTVFSVFEDISDRIGLDGSYMKIVLKVIGIAYVTQLGAELCRDAGESAIASKIEFGGKIMIVALSVPVMYSFLEVVETVINFS
ncbi:MAG: stage III sporulation protein AD [Clostridia bacterium]|nr:stage III sporulation protein AD [Clostridia bacterium]